LRTSPKMTQATVTRFLSVLVVLAAWPAIASAADGPLPLKRGVSLAGWPNEAPPTPSVDDRWLVHRDFRQWGGARDLARIKSLGFDFVRLSVNPEPFLVLDGRRRDDTADRLEQAVRSVVQSGLKTVLALNLESEASGERSVRADRYRAVVADIAAMLARVGTDAAAFELMDGRPQECDASSRQAWEAMLVGLVGAARSVAPDLTLIVSGACGGTTKGLVQLDPRMIDDDHVLYGFQFYEPREFTHQGLGEAKYVKGAPWPADAVAVPLALVYSKILVGEDGSLDANDQPKRVAAVSRYLRGYLAGDWDELRLKARFSEVRVWAERYHLPTRRLFLDAFGVTAANNGHGGALDADRFRWLDAVRREAEALGAAWAYWRYADPEGMSLTKPDGHQADLVALEALGLVDRGAYLSAARPRR